MRIFCDLTGFLFIFSGKSIFGFLKFKNKLVEGNGSSRNAAHRKLRDRKFIRLRQIQFVEKIRIKFINIFLFYLEDYRGFHTKKNSRIKKLSLIHISEPTRRT